MKIILLAALVLATNAMAGGNGYHYGGNYRSSEYSYRHVNPSINGYANADVNQPSYTKRQLARDMDALETRSQLRMYDIQRGGNCDVGYGSYYRY